MHEKRYTRLKLKMLLLVLTGAVVVCALSLFLVEVVVDGFLQDPVSRLFVWVATNLFGQSTEVANRYTYRSGPTSRKFCPSAWWC